MNIYIYILWEKNPWLHRKLKPVSVLCLAFQSDTSPTELSHAANCGSSQWYFLCVCCYQRGQKHKWANSNPSPRTIVAVTTKNETTADKCLCMYFLLSIKLLSLQFLADIKSVSHLTIAGCCCHVGGWWWCVCVCLCVCVCVCLGWGMGRSYLLAAAKKEWDQGI